MEPLKIEDFKKMVGTVTKKIDGFTAEQIDELEHMDYRDMKRCVLEELDLRNNGIGTCWHNGNGVLNVWTTGQSVYVEIGNTCD